MKDKQAIDTRRRDLLKGLSTAAVAGTLAAGTSTVLQQTKLSQRWKRQPLDIKKLNISVIITTPYKEQWNETYQAFR